MSLLKHLLTQARDRPFHRERRMFCIRSNVVTVAPVGVLWSHVEWFQREGWVPVDDVETTRVFLNEIPRGFYSAAAKAIYIYQGSGWDFSDKTEKIVRQALPELVQQLDLPLSTSVHLGPRDSQIGNLSWPQKMLGTVAELQG